MYKKNKIIGIIPARGGSKGVPKKNIKLINDKPLLTWTIEQANNSKYLDKIFVSTDSKEIADIAKKSKLDVPFLRPENLALDSSPSYEAIIHVIETLEKKGEYYDYLALLEPTSPLRKKDDIDNAIISLISNPKIDSLVSVGEVQTEHPLIMKKIDKKGLVNHYISGEKKIHQRQQADKAFFPYGVIYLCKTEVYKKQKSFYLSNTIPYQIERWQNYEIDDLVDFNIIEFLMSK